MTDNEFKEWSEKLSKGDHSLTIFLLSAYGRACELRLMKRYNCSENEATDILMDVLLDLLEKILDGRITSLKNPEGYLLKACEYRYLNLYKALRREREKESDLLLYFYEEIYDEGQLQRLIDSELMELVANEKNRKLQAMEKAYKLLKPRCQRLLELFYLEGKSMKEIAELMEFANANVAKTSKNRCFNAWRKGIDELLEENSENEQAEDYTKG